MNQAKLQLFIGPDETFPAYADMILPQSLAKKWRLMLNAPFSLSCGSTTTNVRLIYSRKTNKNCLRLRKAVAETLGLYHDGILNVRYLPRYHRFQIGPLLGILTNGINRHLPDEQRFGGMTRFYTECQLSAETRGVHLFIFSPEDLNVQSRQIIGWHYEKGRFRQDRFPLPDVIYNRITSRRVEAQETLQQKLQWLQRRHRVHLFNVQFLDKWQVHDALCNDPDAKFMLPHTKTYETAKQLQEMLKKYPIVYIKPVNGSLGQGVMRLALRGKHYHMQYTTLNGTITKSDVTFQEIVQQMTRRKRHGKYLIQQGLPLITSLGRSIDFRALLQKNGVGKWSITSIVGRIAGDTKIVSNLARGGTIASVQHVINQIDPGQPKPTVYELRQSALKVAHAFERQIDGHFAELGIDLAVDKNGKVWLLEINSKPSKTDDTVTNPALSIRPSVHKTIDYTCFITGYPSTNTSALARKKRR